MTSPDANGSTEINVEDEGERLESAKKKLESVIARRIARAKVSSNIGAFRISVVGDSGIGKVNFFLYFVLFIWI